MKRSETTEPDPIYRNRRAAAYLDVSTTTLWRIQKAGKLRAVRITGGATGYRLSELNEYLNRRSEG